MVKNLFCYVKEIDLLEDMKATDLNTDCIGCSYFSVCEKDMNIKVKVSNKKELESTEVKTSPKSKVKEKVKKEVKPKPKTKPKSKRSKKQTLEDLAGFDDDDIF